MVERGECQCAGPDLGLTERIVIDGVCVVCKRRLDAPGDSIEGVPGASSCCGDHGDCECSR